MAELSEQPEPEAVINRPNDDRPKPEAVINHPADEKSKAVKSVPKSRGGLWFVLFTLLLLIAMAGAGVYFFMQLRDKQEGLGGEVKKELTQKINDYQGQLTAIQSQVAALQTEIAGKEDHFNKTLADFSGLHTQKMEATRKELSDKVLQVQRQLGKTRGDWLIADAEYLLGVASERLHLAGDLETTRTALEAADQRLRESGDSGIIPIREQIAKELSQLQGINRADIVGLYASIQALEADVAKLTLALPYSGKPLTPTEEATNSSAVDDETNGLVKDAIHGLEGIVSIKRTDKPVKEILTQEQADFIREQLKVKLEVVKIALVQQNDNLYQTTLADLKKWVGEHFNDNESAKLFVGELTQLQDAKLRSQLPDISLSLKMLRDVSKLRVETDK
ncbi:partial uroporphyrin-III C-methyltransferase, partial [biofilm metagenome]